MVKEYIPVFENPEDDDLYYPDNPPIHGGSTETLTDVIYWKRKSEKLLIQSGLEKTLSEKPKKKRKGHKTGISVRLNSQEAKKVYKNFSFSEAYLKDIINQYVPRETRKPVDNMNYEELQHYGHVIFSVAKKELGKQ